MIHVILTHAIVGEKRNRIMPLHQEKEPSIYLGAELGPHSIDIIHYTAAAPAALVCSTQEGDHSCAYVCVGGWVGNRIEL